MKGLSTWAPDWTYRQENPRHRLLKSIPFEKWYDNEIERRGAPKFNYDPNNFHNGAFTSKPYRLSSILQLGRVLDTTSFELSSKDGESQRARINEWLENQAGFDDETMRTRIIHISARGGSLVKMSCDLLMRPVLIVLSLMAEG
jgi:hypothetical protein